MMQPKPIDVKPLKNYRILVTFETGEIKIFDVTPYISGDWFGKLKETEYFNTVHIHNNIVTWAGEQDIAPHELYEFSIPQNEIATELD